MTTDEILNAISSFAEHTPVSRWVRMGKTFGDLGTWVDSIGKKFRNLCVKEGVIGLEYHAELPIGYVILRREQEASWCVFDGNKTAGLKVKPPLYIISVDDKCYSDPAQGFLFEYLNGLYSISRNLSR